MVDSPNTTEAPAPVPGPPKPKSPIVVFLTSSTGRLIIGGVVLFTIVLVAGAFLFSSLLNNVPNPPAITAPATSSSAEESSAVATRPPEPSMDDSFTFRNVFAPTVKPPIAASVIEAATSSGDSSSSDSSSTIPADTLVLKSIVTDDGKKVASLYWNGTVYKCHEGDTVDSSPWQVVTLYSDSALMLYGDSRVTLTVGQGFSK